ncbi:unnamed protein product [Cladocopium goreaui]|uniref:Uncharacterized protein n=1 Tax=Cladocopium goreaui TaxID=2562237 RepID=A0A9P1DLL6_9DINO|nr:unnamed protein product [Cladocopium goreaui]
MALKSLVSNLVSGQHSHDGHSTCLSDGHHGHAFGPMASSFTAFFPDAVAPHHSDHFLPSIAPETVHQDDAAHLDQFDQSLLATRRPKTYVSFHKEEGEEKKEGDAAHLDQFDQSLLATRRPKTYVSFHKEEGEEKKEGDAAHLDQFDQSLLATRRPKTYVSFHKEEGEEKKEGVIQFACRKRLCSANGPEVLGATWFLMVSTATMGTRRAWQMVTMDMHLALWHPALMQWLLITLITSCVPETVHQGDAAHLDLDQSLLATRRPKNVSFHKEEGEEKKEGE